MLRFRKRRLLLVLLILFVLALPLVTWAYLRSDYAARQVENRLSKAIGAPCRVGKVSIGFGGTSIHDLRIYETGPNSPSEPWIAVPHLETDVTLWRAIFDDGMPESLRFLEPRVRLRLDRHGALLTGFPQPKEGKFNAKWPRVLCERGQFTLAEEGRENATFMWVRLEATPAEQLLDLKLRFTDPFGGRWRGWGDLDTSQGSFQIELQTRAPHYLTEAYLQTIPFVPSEVWDEVQLNGLASANIFLRRQPAELFQFLVNAEVTEAKLTIPSIQLTTANTSGFVHVERGQVRLSNVRGQTANGEINADGTIDFRSENTQFQFQVGTTNTVLRELPDAWSLPPQLDGKLTGNADFTLTRLRNGQLTFDGEGKGTVAEATLGGKPIAPVQLALQQEGNQLVLVQAKPPTQKPGQYADLVPYVLKWVAYFVKPADAPAEEKRYLHLNLALNDVDLGALLKTLDLKLPVQLGGKVSVDARISIPTDTPDQWNAYRVSGTASSPKLMIDDFAIEQVQAKIDFRDGVAKITEARATALGGEFKGSGTISLDEKVPGSARVDIAKLDLNAVSERILGAAKLKLEGRADGVVKITLPPVKADGKRVIDADVELTAPKLKVQGVPTEKLKATATYVDGVLKYRLVGEALGGKFDLDGQYPPTNKQSKSNGKVRLRNLQLTKLGAILGFRDVLAPFAGTAHFDFDYSLGEDGAITGNGRIRLEQIRWEQREIVSAVTANIRLTANELRIEELSSSGGEGTIRGHVLLDRKRLDNSRFSLTLDRVPASKLLFAIPEAASSVDTLVDFRMSGNLGREMRGSGTITAARGKMYHAPLVDLRLPFSWKLDSVNRRGELTIPEITATLAGGSITGKVELLTSVEAPVKLTGELRFRKVDVRAFTSSTNATGANPVTGQFTFSATNPKSINDLTGNLVASIGEARPFELPILTDLVPFLGAAMTRNSTTEGGEVNASLSQGVWRISKLGLHGPRIKFFAEGTVTLQGRIQLDVAALTGNFRIDPNVARTIGLRIPSKVGPIPITVLSEVAGRLSNRVIHANISGTTKSPTIRLNLLAVLSNEAVRFFWNYIGLPRIG